MRNVLIVDDETFFVNMVSEGLTGHLRGLNVLTACDGLQALSILEREHIDLVITDLKMPVMDGFEFLARLVNTGRKIPVIVMTAFGNTEMEEQVRDLGAAHYIEKPIDFLTLAEAVESSLSAVARGHIEGITLFGFLQLLHFEKKTCAVRLESRGDHGVIYFESGDLVDAATEHKRGEAATYEILGWENTVIEIDNVYIQSGRSIHAPLDHLLMEAARLKDEAARGDADPGREHGDDEPDGEWGHVIASPSTEPAAAASSTESGTCEATLRERWAGVHSTLGDRFESAFVAAVLLDTGSIVVLQRGSGGGIAGEPVRSLLEILARLTSDSARGTFEYVTGEQGIGLIWDHRERFAVVLADAFASQSAAPWFRSHVATVARSILEVD